MKRSTIIKTVFLLLFIVIPPIYFYRTSSSDSAFKNSSQDMVLEESGSASSSLSREWWLDSGGYFYIGKDSSHTNLGRLNSEDYWRKLYNQTSPIDTDNGFKPQNLFRLISQKEYGDVTQELYFQMHTYNMNQSPSRNETNGILLLSRYIDADNFYYAGVRVDGTVVIKRKFQGTYTTLAQRKILSGSYDKFLNPNLIPIGSWIGLRSEVHNTTNGAVEISLFIELSEADTWQLVLVAKDNTNEKIQLPAHVGIRTDFADVSFKNYRIKSL